MPARPSSSVLIVDDDAALGLVLVGLLGQAGISARHVGSAAEALRVFATSPFDVVLTDFQMPGRDGVTLLRDLKRQAPEVPVILLTAHGSVSLAVEAMKSGAADFLTKPFDREEVVFTVKKALASSERADAYPPRRDDEPQSLLGTSAAMREVSDLVRRAAGAQATVLVRGESGTGKEVVARAIHDGGARRAGPFVAVNCAALPEQLLESELFGHERGAFTGAVNRKPGRVELASGGTLFLDEIGDVSATVQPKLLRLLQSREYLSVGGTRTEKADVRFIAATHRDLEEMVQRGTFREDLYYRLAVLPIRLPPLRDRVEDVAPLATRFFENLARENGRPELGLSEAALRRLGAHGWPGNVRELENVIERLVVFTDGSVIGEADVARELTRHLASPAPAPASSPPPASALGTLLERRNEAERGAVVEALRRAGGNRTKAARLLGIGRRTLYKRLDGLGIDE